MAIDRIKRPCRHLNCPNVVEGSGYCDEHRGAYDRRRGSPTARGYNHKWQKARLRFLSHNPICVRCGRAAEVVDHIRPHKGNQQLFWDTSNWQPLCKQCHDRKTMAENQ